MPNGHPLTQDDLDRGNFINERLQLLIDHAVLIELEEWESQDSQPESWYRILVTQFPDRDYFLNEHPWRIIPMDYTHDEGFTQLEEAETRFFDLVQEMKS